jgi:serine/threonine protein phosphatase PrpC
VDHTPKLMAESERIRALHGFVTSNRVNGVIAISRSLGDASMKPYVSAEPGTDDHLPSLRVRVCVSLHGLHMSVLDH